MPTPKVATGCCFGISWSKRGRGRYFYQSAKNIDHGPFYSWVVEVLVASTRLPGAAVSQAVGVQAVTSKQQRQCAADEVRAHCGKLFATAGQTRQRRSQCHCKRHGLRTATRIQHGAGVKCLRHSHRIASLLASRFGVYNPHSGHLAGGLVQQGLSVAVNIAPWIHVEARQINAIR